MNINYYNLKKNDNIQYLHTINVIITFARTAHIAITSAFV